MHGKETEGAEKETPHIVVSYNPKNDWIHADWQGTQTTTSIKEGCEKILKAVKQHACTKLLTHTEVLSEAWLEAGDWVADNWFPRLAHSGCLYVAWIPPVYGNEQIEQHFIQEIATWELKEITWLMFEDQESAEAWLSEY